MRPALINEGNICEMSFIIQTQILMHNIALMLQQNTTEVFNDYCVKKL